MDTLASHYGPSLLGGMLIGLAAATLLLLNGRIAGISGIVGRLAAGTQVEGSALFLLGLLAGPILYRALFGEWPAMTVTGALPVLVPAGFLVGFGARLGSGCTSGHGVLGLARLSRRSVAAVAVFLAAGTCTVTAMRALGL